MNNLRYVYELIYDIKTEEELKSEVEYLVHRLAGIANLLREDGRDIDGYIKAVLGYEKAGDLDFDEEDSRPATRGPGV